MLFHINRSWRGFGAFALVMILIAQLMLSLPTATMAQSSGTLNGGLAVGPTNHNLTSVGGIDWAVWGFANGGTSTSLAPDVRRSGGTAISSLTPFNACGAPLRGIGQFPITGHRFSWTGGSPTASANRVYTGIQHNPTNGTGCGFSFTVPADTTPRRLRVYMHSHEGRSRITATLSDNSAGPYTDKSIPAGTNTPGLYTIEYAAASANQTLTVQMILEDHVQIYSNVAVYAVALEFTTPPPPADTTAPTVTVEQAGGQSDPTNAGPIQFTVTFSEPVSSFTGADVALGGTAGATSAVVSGGPSVYTVAVSGMTGDGTVTAAIPAGAASDAAGNPSAASTSADNSVSYDATAPTTTATASGTPVSGCPGACFNASATVTLSVSEPGSTSYRVNGGLWQPYTAPIDLLGEGAYQVEFFSVDSLGNTETPAGSLTVNVTTFATTNVRDPFTRPNGALGSNWRGVEGLGGYQVTGNQVDVLGGGPIYWNPATFGAQQEAFVTLATVDPDATLQALMLKVQGAQTALWQQRDMITVNYVAADQQIVVETYRVGRGWRTVASFSATITNGDTLGTRVLNNGQVRVYVNAALVGSATMAADDQAYFNPRGGRVGLWFSEAADAWLDNFSGSTYTP